MNLAEIAEIVEGELHGDPEREILRVNSLEKAAEHEISFLEKAENFQASNAGCLIVPAGFAQTIESSVIKVKNPKLAFAKIAARLHELRGNRQQAIRHFNEYRRLRR